MIDGTTLDQRRLESNLPRAMKEATQRAPSQSKLRTVKMHLTSRTQTPAKNYGAEGGSNEKKSVHVVHVVYILLAPSFLRVRPRFGFEFFQLS
jgi:hypothetical protein